MKSRYLAPAIMAFVVSLTVSFNPLQADEPSHETWNDLSKTLFGGKVIPLSPSIGLDAPYRAEDAAIVPMTMTLALPQSDSRQVRKITLVIDENPAPVAAVFILGDQANTTRIETRVRVNSYTYVHAVAELSDGSMIMAERYVKASGGCSAPASKNLDEAMANLGKMKLRQFPATTVNANASRDVQLLLRHPNNSGMQFDQVSRNYIPARYISELKLTQGDALLLKIEGGISLSEDPTVRFNYRPTGAGDIKATVIDTNNTKFEDHWPVS